MAGHDARIKLGMILGEAVRPYDRTLDRVRALVEKTGPADEIEQDLADALLGFFTDGKDGSAKAKEAAERRARAVAWALERYGALPLWLEACGVDLEDAAPTAP